jgi:hypothetical protein
MCLLSSKEDLSARDGMRGVFIYWPPGRLRDGKLEEPEDEVIIWVE